MAEEGRGKSGRKPTLPFAVWGKIPALPWLPPQWLSQGRGAVVCHYVPAILPSLGCSFFQGGEGTGRPNNLQLPGHFRTGSPAGWWLQSNAGTTAR